MKATQAIILIRHGKSIKNEQDRHGGRGSELVVSSYDEIELAAKALSQFDFNVNEILFTPRKQCEETAVILGNLLNLKIEIVSELAPIHLGIIDGLSNEEVKNLYPNVVESMKKWRNGEIEINELKIPGMGDSADFFEKGRSFLDRLISEKKSKIIVATRSILVLLTSVMLNRNTEIGGNYREIKWGNSAYAIFTISDLGTSFHVDLSTIRI